MNTPASARPTRVMSKYTKWLGWILVAVCLAAAVSLPVFDKANSEWLGSVMLVVGAALVAAGMFAFGRTAPWLAMALVTTPTARSGHGHAIGRAVVAGGPVRGSTVSIMRGLVGVFLVAVVVAACGGGGGANKPSASGPGATSAGGSAATSTAASKGNSSFKTPKPGSDPCLLLTAAAAKQALGVPTVVKGPRPQAPSWPGVRTSRQCLYFVPGSGSTPDAYINVDLKAMTRAAYETHMAASIARRPAGAAECVTVPDLGDAANYCPGIFTARFAQGSFVSVLVGQTRINGGAYHYDAQWRERPNKAESIALLRQVLTP